MTNPPQDGAHSTSRQSVRYPASARLCAARAVLHVLRDQEQLETALSRQPDYAHLAPRDRAFARLITATVFRRLGQIDAALKPYIKRTPGPLPHAVLRTGAAQLLFLKTPPHAAIGESVQLLKGSVKTRAYSGMVNAVLRRVAENGSSLAIAAPPSSNIPGWIRASWEKTYGKAVMRRMAQQLTAEPPLDIHVRSDVNGWAERLGGDKLSDWMIRLPKSGQVTEMSGFDEGQWWVQDFSASLPVQSLIQELDGLDGLTVLDMCAAPGGKTLQLAAAGAAVTALDKSEDRLERVSENLARTGLSAEIIAADAFEWARNTDRQFDIVLLDAPCSATGTFRRHPDVLYNRTPKDVGGLARIQRAMLAKTTNLVKPGGYMLYCSCSLQYEEGEAQAEHFLKTYADFALVALPMPALKNPAEVSTNNGYLRILPHVMGEIGGADGFFAALCRKGLRNRSKNFRVK